MSLENRLMLPFLTSIISCLLFLAACSSSPEKRGSASISAAGYSGDWMTFSKPQQPEREVNDFNFFYKHCSVDERHPFPKGASWECSNP